jgi:hypothetical protein
MRAMRIVSRIVLVIGLVVLITALGFTAKTTWDVFGNMQPKNSIAPIDPNPWIWASVGLGILGGFVTGLALAMPKGPRTPPPPPAS